MWWTTLIYEGSLNSDELLYCPETKYMPQRITAKTLGEHPWWPGAVHLGTVGMVYGSSSYLSYPSATRSGVPFKVDRYLRDRSAEAAMLDSMKRSPDYTYESMRAAMGADGFGEPDDCKRQSGIYANVPNRDLSMRHGFRANALFFDFHVETVDGEGLFVYTPNDPQCIYDGK